MQNNSSDKPFKPGIGIDFGTSNSAAAVFDGEQVRLVQLSELNPIMPSANYIDRDFASTIGQPAIDDYISDNQGRKVELSVEVIGEARTSAGTGDGPVQVSRIPARFMGRRLMMAVAWATISAVPRGLLGNTVTMTA